MKKTSLKNEYKVDQDFIFGAMTKVGRRSINATEKISQCRKKSSRHNYSSSPPRLTSKGRCHIGIQCVMPSVPWNPFGFSAKPLRFPRLRVGNKRQPIVPLKEWKLVRGDTVMILGGKDRGKIGKINEVVRSKNWVFVEGLNTHKRYIPPQKGYDGGLTNSEAPLQVSEVSLIDPSDGKPTDITYRYTEKGEKVRVSDRTGRIIPKPPWERRDVKNRSAIKDGDFDTPPSAVTKKTYIPSLLYFHEEIMHALKVPPTIPKTEPDRRDLMMKEVEKAANWHLDTTANAELSLIDKIYFSVSNYADRLIRFLRIDKL